MIQILKFWIKAEDAPISPFFTAERGCKKWLNQRWGWGSQTNETATVQKKKTNETAGVITHTTLVSPSFLEINKCSSIPPTPPAYTHLRKHLYTLTLYVVYISFLVTIMTQVFSLLLFIPQFHNTTLSQLGARSL